MNGSRQFDSGWAYRGVEKFEVWPIPRSSRSITGPRDHFPGRSEVQLSRQLGKLEIAGAKPAVLTISFASTGSSLCMGEGRLRHRPRMFFGSEFSKPAGKCCDTWPGTILRV